MFPSIINFCNSLRTILIRRNNVFMRACVFMCVCVSALVRTRERRRRRRKRGCNDSGKRKEAIVRTLTPPAPPSLSLYTPSIPEGDQQPRNFRRISHTCSIISWVLHLHPIVFITHSFRSEPMRKIINKMKQRKQQWQKKKSTNTISYEYHSPCVIRRYIQYIRTSNRSRVRVVCN